METDFDFGYFNGGQRRRRDLVRGWRGLLRGDFLGRPLAGLGVSEVADQVDTLDELRDEFLVVQDHSRPDSAKEALILNPLLVEPVGDPWLYKVGDAFQGRRPGGRRFRMGNKYVLSIEVLDLASRRTPILAVGHGWPSVRLNRSHVEAAERRVADWVDNATRGSLFLARDQNMPSTHPALRHLRDSRLTSGQLHFDGLPTWGRRAIDDVWAVESDHYRMVGLDTVEMPGRERGLRGIVGGGHRAVVLTGKFRGRG